MSRAGHGLAFQRQAMERHAAEVEDPSPFLQYAMLAAADPKAPAEFRAMGPSVWFLQFALVTGTMYYVDPLSIREGEGLDETWNQYSNPMFNWPSKFYEGAMSLIPEQPSFWDFW